MSALLLCSGPFRKLNDRLKDCSSSGNEALWQVDDISQATLIKSRAFGDETWCLDAGGIDEDGQPVTISPVSSSSLGD